jgi:hypothetical protein
MVIIISSSSSSSSSSSANGGLLFLFRYTKFNPKEMVGLMGICVLTLPVWFYPLLDSCILVS